MAMMPSSFKFWLLATTTVLVFQPHWTLALSLTPQSTLTGTRTKSKELPRNHERILSFDTKEFPLCELVADALECHPNELGQLHSRDPEDYCDQGRIRGSLAGTRTPQRRVELLRRALTNKWKMSSQKRQWENDYLPRIVRDVVGSNIMEGEQQLIYQRSPMLRFHVAWPLEPEEVTAYDNTIPPLGGRNPGTLAGLHTDEEYGHPPGEVNFFLPVTSNTYDTNSLYVEGDAMRGDFEPFELSYGEMMMWNGNSCRHCSPRNISDQTRISFDFRVIAGSDWIDPPKKKGYFQLGSYYVDANSV
ncbi:hypothetical protein ACHAXR_009689 [Thalassiosira sp. AJA248-18]